MKRSKIPCLELSISKQTSNSPAKKSRLGRRLTAVNVSPREAAHQIKGLMRYTDDHLLALINTADNITNDSGKPIEVELTIPKNRR